MKIIYFCYQSAKRKKPGLRGEITCELQSHRRDASLRQSMGVPRLKAMQMDVPRTCWSLRMASPRDILVLDPSFVLASERVTSRLEIASSKVLEKSIKNSSKVE